MERTRRDEESRKELLAGISHDLRSPLTSIRAYVEGLMDGVAKTEEAKQRYLRTINTKAEDIDRLVSQLFLYSKLDLEGASMDLRPIRLDEFIIGFAEEAAPNSRARGLEITAEQRAAREIRVGGVRLNPETRRVFVDGREVSLKSRVYELLQFLMLHTDIVFSREELYEKIRGLEAMGDNATVAVHINRVREKIEQDPGHPRYIQTVWGAGYRFKGQ